MSTRHQDLSKNLVTLNQIFESLNQAVDVRQTLDFALTRLVELMGLETGWIFLKDPSSQNRWAGKGYTLAAHHNLPPAMGVRRARAWKGNCECQTLCQKGKLTGAYNQVQCSRLRNAPGDRRELTVHATAPLRSGDNVWGILNVAAPDWDYFSEEALVLLANVGSQMGIALERAYLFDLIQEQRIHEQAVLLELSNQLLGRPDLDDLMNYVAAEIPRLLGVDACALLLPGEDPAFLDFRAASGWLTDPVAAGRRVPADARSGSGQAMLTQEPLLIEDLVTNDPTPWSAEWLRAEGFRGHTVMPLLVEGHAIGTIIINTREPRLFNENDLRFLRLMANQAAIAIEKARLQRQEIQRQRLEDELSVGQQIQLSLLPEECPMIEGWDIAAAYKPARLVGGDFYDFFDLEDDSEQLGLVIADVAGKGVPAALFMALSRSLIRTVAMSGRQPADVLARSNRLIYNDTRSKLFLTAFYAKLNLRTGQMAYANAGHNWPLWVHAQTGQVTLLKAKGIVLGAFEQVDMEQKEIQLAPGDLIIFYTDGITEAMNAEHQLFGMDRLETLVMSNPQTRAQQVIDTVVEAVEEFTGGTPQSDDFTLLVIKWRP